MDIVLSSSYQDVAYIILTVVLVVVFINQAACFIDRF